MSAVVESTHPHQSLSHARGKLVRQLAATLDGPMTFLAFVWLILLVLDLTRGLNRWETIASNTIWVIFIVHFVLELLIAPNKWTYLKQNWITAIALVLPALRVLRIFRAFRILRATRAVAFHRPSKTGDIAESRRSALHRGLRRCGFGYVAALTVIVTFAGAAGVFNFENPPPSGTTARLARGSIPTVRRSGGRR